MRVSKGLLPKAQRVQLEIWGGGEVSRRRRGGGLQSSAQDAGMETGGGSCASGEFGWQIYQTTTPTIGKRGAGCGLRAAGARAACRRARSTSAAARPAHTTLKIEWVGSPLSTFPSRPKQPRSGPRQDRQKRAMPGPGTVGMQEKRSAGPPPGSPTKKFTSHPSQGAQDFLAASSGGILLDCLYSVSIVHTWREHLGIPAASEHWRTGQWTTADHEDGFQVLQLAGDRVLPGQPALQPRRHPPVLARRQQGHRLQSRRVCRFHPSMHAS